MKTLLKSLWVGMLLTTAAGCTTSTPSVSASHRPAANGTELNEARLLYGMGRYDAAEHKLHEVLLSDPDNPTALGLLMLVERGRFRRESGQEQPRIWGYYQTIPPQPIYR
jgi:Tfp pilus assembly protein PilF